MPRGRKPLPKDYRKLISETNTKIQKYKKRLEELEQDKITFMRAYKQEQMEGLYNDIVSSGKTVEELQRLLHEGRRNKINTDQTHQ